MNSSSEFLAGNSTIADTCNRNCSVGGSQFFFIRLYTLEVTVATSEKKKKNFLEVLQPL